MIRDFLRRLTLPPTGRELEDTGLAATVLLVEVMKADYDMDEDEKKELLNSIHQLTGLEGDAAQALLTEAIEVSDEANDLYHFTTAIHEAFTNSQKSELLTALWRVAYANNELDKYEEHIIRRIAELLYLPHSEFIKTKLKARDQ